MTDRPSLLARRLRLLTMLTVVLGVSLALSMALRTEAPPAEQPAEANVSLPLTGLTILVDPGHGGYDGGARARDSGQWEKELNLAVALEVEKALTAQGAAVTMTRREDTELSDASPVGVTKKRQDMERRVALGESIGADLVLSIHMNEYRDRRQSGPQVFYTRTMMLGGCWLAVCRKRSLTAFRPNKNAPPSPGTTSFFVSRFRRC